MNSWRKYNPKTINRGILGSSNPIKSSNCQAILDSCPFEHDEQVKVVEYMALRYPNILTYAIPNGGGRTAREGARLKAEGVVPGMPDLHILSGCQGYGSLWVEIKRIKGSRTTPGQLEIHEKLRDFGDMVVVCKGHEEAIKEIEWYLNG